MGSESIAHEAIDSEAMRVRGIIFLVQRSRQKNHVPIYLRTSFRVELGRLYLTIIPGARMGSESIAHEAIDSEAMRVRGIIFLVQSN